MELTCVQKPLTNCAVWAG